MKVLLDTNVLISYLLTDEKSTIAQIVEAAFARKYTLILPREAIAEFERVIAEKDYLSTRIPKTTAQKFLSELTLIAITPPRITDPIPLIGRDRADDYLLAYGTVAACDYLVTGDPDLHVVQSVGNLIIVNPSAFANILQQL